LFKNVVFLDRVLDVFEKARKQGTVRVSSLRSLGVVPRVGQQDARDALNSVIQRVLADASRVASATRSTEKASPQLASSFIVKMLQKSVNDSLASLQKAVMFERHVEHRVASLRAVGAETGFTFPKPKPEDPAVSFVVSAFDTANFCAALSNACGPGTETELEVKAEDLESRFKNAVRDKSDKPLKAGQKVLIRSAHCIPHLPTTLTFQLLPSDTGEQQQHALKPLRRFPFPLVLAADALKQPHHQKPDPSVWTPGLHTTDLYDLVQVIVHEGHTFEEGHYWIYVLVLRCFCFEWFELSSLL
jgi:hypothetical protein